ncbi:shikimate dehydrogenase family protein [Glutamicibacter sp.]|jgi:Shikimate 5-dehydrogenase|uniref:shikimate dehydrogenase family protein n=1 Tax=Glutamicibacter sp. TaxID=1931995 RepID=UPI002B47AEFC|nr:shikimate dehydrogenase [Glutamicibacter sp.]HJX79749.1 shikimate dehydrogenase [Glutamicibacter sp.]
MRAAVLGQPISHSKSPVLHRAAYALLGADIAYEAIELAPSEAAEFAQQLRVNQWAGCSVTMPLKDVFVPLMDEVSDRVARLGALNTIVVRGDGSLFGENTDVAGIVLALSDAGVRHSSQATILGAGNTALAAIEAAGELGTTELKLVVRDTARASRARSLAQELGMRVELRAVAELNEHGITADPLVISTLPPRAADSWVQPLGAGQGVLLDVAYDPWPSELAQNWAGTVISGLHMLVHQAVEQARYFSALPFDEQTRENVTNAMYHALGLHRRG